MRLKSSIWVAAYLRRCQNEGIFGAVRKRGAEEAGAVFVKVAQGFFTDIWNVAGDDFRAKFGLAHFNHKIDNVNRRQSVIFY